MKFTINISGGKTHQYRLNLTERVNTVHYQLGNQNGLMAFIIIWPGFYSRNLNIRVYIIQYFTHPSHPPRSFRPRELPRSPGNYEVDPRNSDYSRVPVACKIDYSSYYATNLLFIWAPCIHVKCYILGLYSCKSFYRRLIKNSYDLLCF